MSKQSVYRIERKGRKVIDDYRGDRIYGDTYTVLKDGRPAYEVVTSTLADWCDCPAGRRWGKCKHLQMAYDFQVYEKDAKGA